MPTLKCLGQSLTLARWIGATALLIALCAGVPAGAGDADDCRYVDQVKTEPDRVVAACRRLAEQGEAFAQTVLGFLYATGQGVRQDYAEAAKWYHMAAELGLAQARYLLGGMYQSGSGLPQNNAEAAMWFRRAAEQGMADAQVRVGGMYNYGRGLPLDLVQAYMWFSLAARQSVEGALVFRDVAALRMTPAQIKQGESLAAAWRPKSPSDAMRVAALPAWAPDRDDCFKRKVMTACRWLAQKGDSDTQLFLGEAYLFGGLGLPHDYAEALRWLRLAADQGSEMAAYHLGTMYEEGRGVPQDNVQALAWYTLANINGMASRNYLAANMTPPETEQSQRLVNEWRATHPDWPAAE